MYQDSKPRPNHRKHLETLRQMTKGDSVDESLEFPEFGQALFKEGSLYRFPQKYPMKSMSCS
jgi:hypothetical protein